jgi:hypothetical protein
MTWIALVTGVVAGVPLLAWLAGGFLPRDHVAQMSLEVGADPGQVWTLIADVTGTSRWRPDVRQVESRPPVGGRPRFVETTRHGPTPFEIVAQAPPATQVVRVVDDGLPFGGTWTWELTPRGTGTRLTITEDGFIESRLFRVMSRLFFPPTATMDAYLRALAAELGERAEPEVIRAR